MFLLKVIVLRLRVFAAQAQLHLVARAGQAMRWHLSYLKVWIRLVPELSISAIQKSVSLEPSRPRTNRFSKYNIDGIGEYVPD
jgi:hypothetical protein